MTAIRFASLALAGLIGSAGVATAQEAPQLQGRLSPSVANSFKQDRLPQAAATTQAVPAYRQRTVRIIPINRPSDSAAIDADRFQSNVSSGR